MSIIVESIFLFIYLMTLFFFKFPDITNNNYLFHKLIIFITTFIFKFAIELYKKIKENTKVDPMEILNNSVEYSLFNILGYSIYIDLMYMKIPYENIYINIDSDNQRYFVSSLITSLFVFLIGFAKSSLAKK
jgi:hypothetical protein